MSLVERAMERRAASGVGAEAHAALALYTAAFCIDFMGEVGQRFTSEPLAVDAASAERLASILRGALAELAAC